jgi:transposase
MRRSFDRLAEEVRAVLGEDPMSGHLFVFRSRSGERAKILWWDRGEGQGGGQGGGFVLYYKRLERGTFRFPSSPPGAGKSVAIESRELMRLLAGLPVEGLPGEGLPGEAGQR